MSDDPIRVVLAKLGFATFEHLVDVVEGTTKDEQPAQAMVRNLNF